MLLLQLVCCVQDVALATSLYPPRRCSCDTLPHGLFRAGYSLRRFVVALCHVNSPTLKTNAIGSFVPTPDRMEDRSMYDPVE